jgi:hypothetical protein
MSELREARVARVLFEAANLEVVTGDPDQVDDDLVRKWSHAVAGRVIAALAIEAEAAAGPRDDGLREAARAFVDCTNPGYDWHQHREKLRAALAATTGADE